MKSRLERLEPRDDRVLRGRVDRGRVVAALARAGAPARARLASAARARIVLDVGDAGAAEREPVDASYRVEEQAARQLREEVRRLLRHHLAAPRALEDVLDPRRPEQEGAVELARVDARDRLVEIGRVAEPLVPDEPVDELDVELARLARRPGTSSPCDSRPRGRVVGQAGEPGDGRRRARPSRRRSTGGSASVVPAEEPVGGEDLEPGVARSRRARPSSARSPASPPRRRTRAPSRSGGARRRSGAAGRRMPRRHRRPGRARAACRRPSRSGSRSRHGDDRVAVVEKKDRFELGFARLAAT